MKKENDIELVNTEIAIYQLAGMQFSISSAPQVIRVLEQCGVVPKKLTPKGSLSTKDDALAEIADQHPMLMIIVWKMNKHTILNVNL